MNSNQLRQKFNNTKVDPKKVQKGLKEGKLVRWKDYYNKLPKAQKRNIQNKKKYYKVLDKLRKIRKEKGLSQEKLSHLTGIPRVTITMIESGTRNATLDKLLTLADALDLEMKFEEVVSAR